MTPKPMTPSEQRARIKEEARREILAVNIGAAAEGLPPGSATMIRAMVEDGLSPAAARKRLVANEQRTADMNAPEVIER